MMYQGNNPIVRRSQGLTADDEFFCPHCGAQGRLFFTNWWGSDDEGDPDLHGEYRVICTVCDADHIEFKADAFDKQIIAAEKKARQHIIDHLPAGDYKRRLVSGDWGPLQDEYWNRVPTMLALLAEGLNDADLALFEEVAASRGWVIPSDQDAADGEEPDFNIMARAKRILRKSAISRMSLRSSVSPSRALNTQH